MGLFDDVNRFLEQRLDEFLKNNPHLELQALEEQLREQEEDTLRLIADLQRQQETLQQEILNIAEDIKRWHSRIQKAQAAGEHRLAEAAQEREAALLRQGNQKWGQMEGTKQNIEQAKQLYKQTQQKRKEVQAKAATARTQTAQQKATSSYTSGWNQASSYQRPQPGVDPLEDKFRKWEMDDELEQMKRDMGN
ncbi:TIGR04376 family protein [Spirulina sp. CS-785/01]|uniref:TIGR04376 family protein n=1 Tax=Spirulina sp. CS-785/01 TaxID=3021716 RepID=UPI00232D565A|nr:TIGR04376 family protein [Spirulina sp. CS-785/01]MDB9312251.1 TIGR04376 family protein [Spirulina sp. CS-785/01]